MLEFFLLPGLCKQIRRNVQEKGRKAIGYQFLLILLWIAAEIGGIVACMRMNSWPMEEISDHKLVIALAGQLGACVGAWLAFQIVRALPNLQHKRII